jgi:cofilin
LKLGKDLKWIIYKISDDWKEIVVEETSNEANYDVFRDKLLNSKSKDRKGKEGIGGRYAVYDVEYDLPGGEGTRSKITFISWCPDDAPQYVSLPCFLSESELGGDNGMWEDVGCRWSFTVLTIQNSPA